MLFNPFKIWKIKNWHNSSFNSIFFEIKFDKFVFIKGETTNLQNFIFKIK